jgi:methionine-gamma-lyase
MSSNSDRRGFSTRSVHVQVDAPPVSSHPVSPPIVQTSSFAFDSMSDLDAVAADSGKGYAYSRLKNPTVDHFEVAVADLEGAQEGVAFGSGMAAIHAAMLSLCSAGDHVVAPRTLYGGAHALFTHVFPRLNIDVTFVPNDDLEALERAIEKNTKVVYAETITNPTLEIADLKRQAEIAHRHGAAFVVDSTLASPALCRPIEHGADLVIHSASKYLGGHGDLIAGVVVGAKAHLRPIRKMNLLVGGCCAPFVAWLVVRGIKTLRIRMKQHCDNALGVAEFLRSRPEIEVVHYPGLTDHPSHERAKAHLDVGFGAMVSFVVPGGLNAARTVLDRLELFERAGSLGDAHSLALLPALASHRSFSIAEREAAGMPDGFVRLSIGLEDLDDLRSDLRQALNALD